MNHITLAPENEKEWLGWRKKDITSTDIAALFGISPYATIFELYHQKRGTIESSFRPNERSSWGNALEASIAKEVATRLGLEISPMKYYGRIEGLGLGSSFDFSIDDLDNLGILEIKNVDKFVYMDEWTETEAPLHIEIQVQHQLLVSNRGYAYICALVGGNELKMIRRERDEAVIDQIIERSAWFWDQVNKGLEPKPDYEKDFLTIDTLYNHATPDSFKADTSEELALLSAKYIEVAAEATKLDKIKKALKAQILEIIEDYAKVEGVGFKISAGMVGESEISYTRESYRLFKVTKKKGA